MSNKHARRSFDFVIIVFEVLMLLKIFFLYHHMKGGIQSASLILEAEPAGKQCVEFTENPGK